MAQSDLSVKVGRSAIGASVVGHAEAIPIVKHRTKLEKEHSLKCSHELPSELLVTRQLPKYLAL